MIPSERDRKGFEGMNWSMRLISVFTLRSCVLKNEASTRGGNASWNEKYPTTQITQKSRRRRNALRAMAFAVSRFSPPMPTIRERATDGRMVICQILTNVSPNGFMTEQRLPKTSPERIPRMKHTRIQLVRFRRGSCMVSLSLCPEMRCTTGREAGCIPGRTGRGDSRRHQTYPVTVQAGLPSQANITSGII